MNDLMRYQRKLIGVEKKLGFLYVPAEVRDLLPNKNAEVQVLLAGDKNPKAKSYNANHNRIFGLTPFYRKNNLSAGDMLSVEVSTDLISISLVEKKNSKIPKKRKIKALLTFLVYLHNQKEILGKTELKK